MGTFESMEASRSEPDDLPELPEGWWDELQSREATGLLNAVLIFHSGGEWTAEKRERWFNAIQCPEATTKALCTAIRAFLSGEQITASIHER
jgi:hypothetical protein